MTQRARHRRASRVRRRPPRLALLLLLPLLAPSAESASAADPFYLNLLEAGTRNYLRGAYPTAAKELRIACFGFLDEPPLLTESLLRLALAQAGAGDESGFRATFDRLLEVDGRFRTYRDLAAETPFKRDFERLLPQHISADELARTAPFAGSSAPSEEPSAALPPRRRRSELERRLSRDPSDREALVLLTRLEISQGRPQKAAKRLERLLAADPENDIAHCVRGQMRLRNDNCAGAMSDLAYCTTPPVDEVLGARYLRCLVETSDWSAAGEHLARLPLEVRAYQQVAELVLAIPPEVLEDLSRPRAETASAPTASRRPATGEPAADQAETEAREIRRRLLAATHRRDLEEPFTQAAELARRNPEQRQIQFLAAEIAYRRGDWQQAVFFFDRGGRPGPEQPLLAFYLAVSLYETGDYALAAEILELALPRLERTPFVDSYSNRILGATPPSPSR